MNTNLGTDWGDFLTEQLQDTRFAFGVLREAATESEPDGYMAHIIERVLDVHSRLAPIVISQYAYLLSSAELDQLAQKFESVQSFLADYAQALKQDLAAMSA